IKSSDLGQSKIEIFNLRGQLIFSDTLKETASYTWNLSATHQGELAQGLYFYRITTPWGMSKLVKFTLIR
ncbi:MAG: T9SS type A sorting domain-containing protein, partial [Candidatus Cloacimonadaceae bacterium]|nr:T9SS type A sorting domain-containing protein [Candidatus Cloacimonadaceae bacterium]